MLVEKKAALSAGSKAAKMVARMDDSMVDMLAELTATRWVGVLAQ